MDPLLIFILDNTIEFRLNYEILKNTPPLTKEQVVDLIISKIDGKDEANFKNFMLKFELLSYKYLSKNDKIILLKNELTELENYYHSKGIWNDPNELRTDILNTEFGYYVIEDKSILYNRQIDDWIYNAANWLVVSRKKEYLTLALDTLLASDKENHASLSPEDGLKHLESSGLLGKDPVEELTKKEAKKKISEKWYALLHMIYIQMKKEIPFEKKITKDELKEFGRKNYPIKGSGHSFYMTIRLIENKGIYKYIFALTKCDFRKWKRTILEISENEQEIKLWMDKNKY